MLLTTGYKPALHWCRLTPTSMQGDFVFSCLWVQVEAKKKERKSIMMRCLFSGFCFTEPAARFPFLPPLIIKAFPINFQIKVRMLCPRGQLVTNATKPDSPPHPLLISHDGGEGGTLKEGPTLMIFICSTFKQTHREREKRSADRLRLIKTQWSSQMNAR